MKPTAITFLLSAVLFACSVKPEPLVFGKDSCYTCKMTLMDKKFGAEILTKKGKVYKFDDVNCMINFYSSGYEPVENIDQLLVIDFANPEKLANAQGAIYIESEAIRSPMGSHVAAFTTVGELNEYNKEWNGKSMKWNELVKRFK